MTAPNKHCAHSACDCDVEPGQAVVFDGQTFCSTRCAEGRGCDHHDCNCGNFPVEEPEERTP